MYFINVIYKCDSDDHDDDDSQSTAPTPTTSASPEPAAADSATTEAVCFEVCLVASRDGFALVPCGNARAFDVQTLISFQLEGPSLPNPVTRVSAGVCGDLLPYPRHPTVPANLKTSR